MIYEIRGEIRDCWFIRHEALSETEARAMLLASQNRHPGRLFQIKEREVAENINYAVFLYAFEDSDIPDRLVACRRAEHQAENLRRQVMFDIFADWTNDELNKAREAADKQYHEKTGYYYPGGRGSIKAF